LTTYHEVSRSFPFPTKKDIAAYVADCGGFNIEVDMEFFFRTWVSTHQDEIGLLHQHTWYRVRNCFPGIGIAY